MKTFIMLLMFSSMVFGHTDNPDELFDIKDYSSNIVDVVIVPVKNLNKLCNEKTIEITGVPDTGNFDSCIILQHDILVDDDIIYVKEKTSIETLGHELRHAIVGDFHE